VLAFYYLALVDALQWFLALGITVAAMWSVE